MRRVYSIFIILLLLSSIAFCEEAEFTLDEGAEKDIVLSFKNKDDIIKIPFSISKQLSAYYYIDATGCDKYNVSVRLDMPNKNKIRVINKFKRLLLCQPGKYQIILMLYHYQKPLWFSLNLLR